jgi:hypothetical protein
MASLNFKDCQQNAIVAPIDEVYSESEARAHRTRKALRANHETLFCFAAALEVRTRPRVAFLKTAVLSATRLGCYFELVLRVVVVTRSSPVSFGWPMASTSLPV